MAKWEEDIMQHKYRMGYQGEFISAVVLNKTDLLKDDHQVQAPILTLVGEANRSV